MARFPLLQTPMISKISFQGTRPPPTSIQYTLQYKGTKNVQTVKFSLTPQSKTHITHVFFLHTIQGRNKLIFEPIKIFLFFMLKSETVKVFNNIFFSFLVYPLELSWDVFFYFVVYIVEHRKMFFFVDSFFSLWKIGFKTIVFMC